MSVWPIIVLGAVSAFFAWRRDKVQELFDPARWKKTRDSNKEELQRSLDALIDFLCKHEDFRWVTIMRAIRAELFTNIELAAHRLEVREKDESHRLPVLRALQAH